MVLAIQENIKSDNQIGNIVQAVFDDVFAIESPKVVNMFFNQTKKYLEPIRVIGIDTHTLHL